MKKLPFILLCILPLNLGALELTGITFGPTNVNLSWSSEYPTGELTNLYIVSRASYLSNEFRYVGNDVLSNNYFSTEDGSISRFYKVRKVKTIDFVDTNLVKIIANQLDKNYTNGSAPYTKFNPSNYIYDIDCYNAIKQLNINETVSNFSGIEYCSSLKALSIPLFYSLEKFSITISNSSSLDSLFVTNNSNITNLNLHNNFSLTNIIIDNCRYLQYLTISNSPLLKTLKVKGNSGNQITNLNLSEFNLLQRLDCSECSLKELNVSGNTNLTYLDCSKNKLINLKLPNSTNLVYLKCQGVGNAFTNLNTTPYSELTEIDCSYNYYVSNFYFFANTKLTNINMQGNFQFSRYYRGEYTIDISPNKVIQYFNCSNCKYLSSTNILNLIISSSVANNINIISNNTLLKITVK